MVNQTLTNQHTTTSIDNLQHLRLIIGEVWKLALRRDERVRREAGRLFEIAVLAAAAVRRELDALKAARVIGIHQQLRLARRRHLLAQQLVPVDSPENVLLLTTTQPAR